MAVPTKSKKTAATGKSKKAARKKRKPDRPLDTLKDRRKREITIRDRRFLESLFRHGNQTRAAEEAGLRSKTRAGLRAMASEKMRKLALPIKQLMDRMGLDDVALIEKLAEGLDALFVKTASHEGRILDEIAYPDYERRREYLDIAFRVRGSYAPEKFTGDIRTHEELTPEEKELLALLKAKLLQASKGKKK